MTADDVRKYLRECDRAEEECLIYCNAPCTVDDNGDVHDSRGPHMWADDELEGFGRYLVSIGAA